MIQRLVAEALDKQVCDKCGEKAGRVDGVVLELRDGKPPRVAYAEVSLITLLARFSGRLARWYAQFDRRFGPERGKPYRIPWDLLRVEGPAFVSDFDVDKTPINCLEDWLRARIVEKIPGANAKSKRHEKELEEKKKIEKEIGYGQ